MGLFYKLSSFLLLLPVESVFGIMVLLRPPSFHIYHLLYSRWMAADFIDESPNLCCYGGGWSVTWLHYILPVFGRFVPMLCSYSNVKQASPDWGGCGQNASRPQCYSTCPDPGHFSHTPCPSHPPPAPYLQHTLYSIQYMTACNLLVVCCSSQACTFMLKNEIN